ncbi:unnamed protein product [Boreogadus saida]
MSQARLGPVVTLLTPRGNSHSGLCTGPFNLNMGIYHFCLASTVVEQEQRKSEWQHNHGDNSRGCPCYVVAEPSACHMAATQNSSGETRDQRRSLLLQPYAGRPWRARGAPGASAEH